MKRVITYGTFDLFHEGHENLLRRAAARGDHLTVGVTARVFDAERGKLNVVESLERRMAHVRATGYADEVIVEDHVGQKVEDIQRLGIDEIVFGSDWTGRFDDLRRYCTVTYLPRTEGISSRLERHRLFAPLRMGVLGSGRIARVFVSETRAIDGVELAGVWSRQRFSAQRLAEAFDLPFFTDELDRLLAQVDAVYIATPHETHHDLALRALAAGCHVLCEKPMALAASDARELLDEAQRRSLVLFEGIKTAYCPGYQRLLHALKSGVIGRVMDVESCFTRLTPPGVRERDDVRYGGAFLEFGSYGLLPIVQLLDIDPARMRFDALRDERGIDYYTKATYADEHCLARALCGLGGKSDGHLVVAGTDGYVLVPAPWWKTECFEIHREDPQDVTHVTSRWEGAGLRYEIAAFVQMIRSHDQAWLALSNHDLVWLAALFERFLAAQGRER